MITITTTVDTDEHGKLMVNTHAKGFGSHAESQMAQACVQGITIAFEVLTSAEGGEPLTTVRGGITEVGQG